MDRKVPSNCLGNTTSTRCLKWEGKSYPDLDILTGDSMEWVIDRLQASLSASVDPVSPTLDMSCLTIQGTSSCAALISARTLAISTSSSTGGVTVVWDSNSIVNALPSGYSISAASVLIRGQDGSTQYSGSNRSGQIAIPLGQFPATMNYTLYVFTDCGNIQLSGVISIDANPGETSIPLTLIDVPTAATQVNSYKEAIELLAREVCALKNNA